MSNTTLLFVIPICFTMFFLTEINGIFGDLDKALNHSKKRKIKWGPFKFLYYENRREECLYNPELEKAYCGTYLPVAILIIIQYVIVCISWVVSISLLFIELTKYHLQILFWSAAIPSLAILIISAILTTVYESKKSK